MDVYASDYAGAEGFTHEAARQFMANHLEIAYQLYSGNRPSNVIFLEPVQTCFNVILERNLGFKFSIDDALAFVEYGIIARSGDIEICDDDARFIGDVVYNYLAGNAMYTASVYVSFFYETNENGDIYRHFVYSDNPIVYIDTTLADLSFVFTETPLYYGVSDTASAHFSPLSVWNQGQLRISVTHAPNGTGVEWRLENMCAMTGVNIILGASLFDVTQRVLYIFDWGLLAPNPHRGHYVRVPTHLSSFAPNPNWTVAIFSHSQNGVDFPGIVVPRWIWPAR
jgi:hypothetical protein